MIEYKLKNDNVLKDGHTMFNYDVVKDLNRKSYLEERQTSEAVVPLNDLLNATRLLVERLDLVHDDPGYQGIWHMAAVHGMNYKGPTYKDELETLKTVLAGI